METLPDNIVQLLQQAYSDSASCDAATLAALTVLRERYPYFIAPALALLRHDGSDTAAPGADSLRRYLAVAAASGRTLAFAAHGNAWRDFYPPVQPPEAKQTTDVIDLFLQTYGSCSPEEEALLERMIFNPTPDFGEILAREEQDNLPEAPVEDDTSQDARIAAFILDRHPAARPVETVPVQPQEEPDVPEERTPHVARPETGSDSLLSESLAQFFIKQHRYERAFEIISALSLKYPKKSAYFADQLRFLQKLIINQRHKQDSGAKK